jgi:serine/threonine protein kinase
LIQAVAFFHARAIIHRDLKPANLLFTENETKWRVKIADFGMARFRLPGEDALTTLVGSPHYVSPEIMKGENDYTGATAVLLRMLSWLCLLSSPMHLLLSHTLPPAICPSVKCRRLDVLSTSCMPSPSNSVSHMPANSPSFRHLEPTATRFVPPLPYSPSPPR